MRLRLRRSRATAPRSAGRAGGAAVRRVRAPPAREPLSRRADAPRSTGVLDACAVNRPAFRALVAAVRAAHRLNSFHNFWRAAALVHALATLLCAGDAKALLNDEDALTLLLAGAP